VEGAEILVLKNAVQLAALQSVKFLVEMHGPKELPMLENAALVPNWCHQK
jgi:hypothetical protein